VRRDGAETALDGIYVIRTSVPKKQMDSAEAVRSLSRVAMQSPSDHELIQIDDTLADAATRLRAIGIVSGNSRRRTHEYIVIDNMSYLEI
jgi:hypothetical protein